MARNFRIVSLACRFPIRRVPNGGPVITRAEPIPAGWWQFFGTHFRSVQRPRMCSHAVGLPVMWSMAKGECAPCLSRYKPRSIDLFRRAEFIPG